MRTYKVLAQFITFQFLAVAISACAALTSATIDELNTEAESPQGVSYYLPKGVIDLTLSVEPRKAIFTLTIDGPRYIPDPGERYYLRYRPLPNYEDKISVETNNRSFLKAVRASSTDHTHGIIVNVAKALSVVGALEAAPLPEAALTLVKVTLDPLDGDDMKAALRQINQHLKAYINEAVKSCGYFGGEISTAGGDSNTLLSPPSVERTKLQKKAEKARALTASDKAILYYDYMTTQYRELPPKRFEEISDKKKRAEEEKKYEEDPNNWTNPINLRQQLRTTEARKQIVDARIARVLRELGKQNNQPPESFACDLEPETALTKAVSANGDDVIKLVDQPRSENDAADTSNPPPKPTDLCDLLLDQKRTEALRVKLQKAIDDYDQKVKEIAQARNDQKNYCANYQKLVSKPEATKTQDAKVSASDTAQQSVTLAAIMRISPISDPDSRVEVNYTSYGAAPSDCSQGICYRPKVPFRLVYGLITDPIAKQDGQFDVGNESVVSMDTAMVELPNREQPITIDIRRAFFINKVQNITFDDDGFLTNVEINKPSELLAVSKVPLDVIDAVAAGLKIRVDLATQQKNLIQREAALLNAQAKLRDTRTQLESGAAARSASSLESSPVRPAGSRPAAASPDIPQ